MQLSGFFAYAQTTGDVTIRVAPRFLAEQSDAEAGCWVWSYHVRLENNGEKPVQLLRRHWFITDGKGQMSEVEGEGVLGEQPVIEPGGSFDYISGCPLPTTSGQMVGTYLMQVDDTCFEVAIPAFSLVQPAGAA